MAVTVRRVTIALGKGEYAWAQRRAKREGRSVSAVLTEAAREAHDQERRRARQDAAWAKALAWATDGRGFSDDDLEDARRELDE